MNEIKTIGFDLAKTVFHAHGVDHLGKVVLKKKLSRKEVLPFFRNLKPCLIGMEAGGGSHYWAREFQAMGHEVKLIAPQFVKPYVKSNKNDANDAEAICEAVTRPSMRFVQVKSVDQQNLQAVHRVRERVVGNRASLACEIRGLLSEYGIVVPQGIRELIQALPKIISDETNNLTPYFREILQELFDEIGELTEKIHACNRRIYKVAKHHPVAKRLTKIPGVGQLAATAMVASVSDPKMFKNGRAFAAYLGLVPRQHSSGGKNTQLGIGKRGDKYIRTLLIHGSRVMVAYNDKHQKNEKTKVWVNKLKERRGFNKTSVALANKMARIAWALMAKEQEFSWAA